MVPRDLIASIPFFAEALNDQELDALAAGAVIEDFEPGAHLIEEQDFSDWLYVVANGEVAVSVHGKKEETPVATLGAGEIVGEMSMLTGAPRAATVIATTPVRALKIGRETLRPLLAAEPDLFNRLADVLHKRQVALDRIYGSGFWNRFAPPRENLSALMRRHLA